MVRPSLRSRSYRRKCTVVPSGQNRTVYLKSKPMPMKCGMCGQPLKGIARSTTRRLPRSKRTVTRLFGGSICAACLRKALKEAARGTT